MVILDQTFYNIFNLYRFYLNHHSNPELPLLQRYLYPKYITGSLYKNPAEENLFKSQFAYLKEKLNTTESEQDLHILKGLETYYKIFESLLPSKTTA